MSLSAQPEKPDQRGSSHAAASAMVQSDSHSDVDFDPTTYNSHRVPITPYDAKYPGKHGAASFFFTDCLSSKAKQQHEQSKKEEEQ